MAKAGIINMHMGDARNPFKPLHDIVANSEMGYKQFIPTHCNRNDYIFEDAKEYGKKGYVDITTSSYPYYMDEEIKPSKALKLLLESGVPIKHITFTSDACGSLPGFDPETGKLIKMEMGLPDSILREIKEAVSEDGIPLEIALQADNAHRFSRVILCQLAQQYPELIDAKFTFFSLAVSKSPHYKPLKLIECLLKI